MSGIFSQDQGPAEVVAAVLEQPPRRWSDLPDSDQTLGVAKLRLAGVYDDRQDGYFMLRLRIPGGRIDADQLEAVAAVADEFARRPDGEAAPDRFVEITTRQDLQLHWIRFEALSQVWTRLRAAGLTSEHACGDTLRNVTSCPVDGADAGAVLDAGPVLRDLDDLARREPRLTAFLPRKFKVAVTGCRSDCVAARLHDLAFTPASRDGEVGFHVHAGGGLSDSPRLASPLDLFVAPAQVTAVVRAALRLYTERGDPYHKAVNRFRILVHQLGPTAVAGQIRDRVPGGLPPAGVDLSSWQACDHLGTHRDRAGDSYVGLCVPVGRLQVDEVSGLAGLARHYGDGGLRLTQRQNVVLTGVADPDGLLAEPLLRRLRPDPDPFERAVLACTSAPFCKFGIVNAKEYGVELIDYLRDRVPEPAWERLRGLRIHLSGCKASCAQVQAAHIGLRATMARDDTAHVEAFDVALDGDVAQGRLGRWAALEVEAPRAFAATAEALAGAVLDGTGTQWEELWQA